MNHCTTKLLRAGSTLLAAGTLLQANGCITEETTSGLLLAILGSIVQDLVAGGFNLI